MKGGEKMYEKPIIKKIEDALIVARIVAMCAV